jgi:hypothetical protein
VSFDGTADKDTISVDKGGVADYFLSSTLISAATKVLNVGVDAKFSQFVFDTGSGTYTYNIDLEEDGASTGDVFSLKISMPSSSNPTVQIRVQGGVTLLTFNATGVKEFMCKMLYNGSSWIAWSVFESVEGTYD